MDRNRKQDLQTLTDLFVVRAIHDNGMGPVIDQRRPLGNSDIAADILELLDIPYDEEYDDFSTEPDTYSVTARDYAQSLYTDVARNIPKRYMRLLEKENRLAGLDK